MMHSLISVASAVRVLVAEDDCARRDTLMQTLSDCGHAVIGEAPTGRQALEKTLELKPDALLLDVNLADGTALDAAHQIAQTLPQVALVLLGGESDSRLANDAVLATSALAYMPTSAPAPMIECTMRLAVTHVRELAAARSELRVVQEQLESRKTIERAKGILMRRTGSSEQEAYRILQRTSQDRSVPMVRIAEAVLASEPGFLKVASRPT